MTQKRRNTQGANTTERRIATLVSLSPLDQRSTAIFLLALLLVGCQREGNAAKATPGIVGKIAPELELSHWIDKSGQPTTPISLQSLRGKIVVLEFWQSWCPGCHSHGLPTAKLIADAFRDDSRVAVLGIQTVFEGHHVNTKDKLVATQKRHKLAIPMAHDPGSKVTGNKSRLMNLYRSGGTPWFVLIDVEGKVLYNDFHVDGPKAIQYIKSLLNPPETPAPTIKPTEARNPD